MCADFNCFVPIYMSLGRRDDEFNKPIAHPKRVRMRLLRFPIHCHQVISVNFLSPLHTTYLHTHTHARAQINFFWVRVKPVR